MLIIGQKKIIRFLEESIKKNTLSHSFIFGGPESLGKTLVAKTLAVSLVYQEKPCFSCLFKSDVEEKFYPDIIEIKLLKQKIGIDQIRDLKRNLFLTPFSKKYKIAIIEQAERLTEEAANSFLKLLEEAPKTAIIILIVRRLEMLLPTIRSRCQILRFSLPSKKEVKEFFKKEFELKDEEAEKFYSLSLGRPGLAIRFLKDKEFLEKTKNQMREFAKFLEKKEIGVGLETKGPLNLWLLVVRDLILNKLGLKPTGLLDEAVIKKIERKYTLSELKEMSKKISRTIFYLEYNVNQNLALENLILSLSL